MNYFLDDRINKAEVLFTGVGFFLIAVFLGPAVHSSNGTDNKKKLNATNNQLNNLENGIGPDSLISDEIKYGTAKFLLELEKKRSIKVSSDLQIL